MHKNLALFTALLLLIVSTSIGQAQGSLVNLEAEIGYDGRFRENLWFPIQVNITNNGDAISGTIIVRPERSSALTNTFSTQVDLASGARQEVMLYATMRNIGTSLTVELFDEKNDLVADVTRAVRQISPRDRLYTVVTENSTNNIDLTSVVATEQEAIQANWFIENIPDKAPALYAINTIIISDANTGNLSTSQRDAIIGWINQGGHLIVTGGSNWQETSAGFDTDLLPLQANGSTTTESLESLTRYTGLSDGNFRGEFVVSTGELSPDARVLVEDEDGNPIVVRKRQGSGTVDYIALSPSAEPLRSWNDISTFWHALMTTTYIQPSWSHGLLNLSPAMNSLEILPGVTALPEVLAMIAFLFAYVIVIGPLNYLVLTRINRREFAWVTIPISIIAFSVLAWTTGFNLRGNDVILSRISVVQSWENAETAQIDQFIGLLAPRRANYNLSVEDNRMFRPITREGQNALLSDATANINIEQSNNFSANEFPVDASFVAGFTASGTINKPQISGSSTITENYDEDTYHVRGSVRNDTAYTLQDAVILTKNSVIRLDNAIEPGSIITFENSSTLTDNFSLSAPSPLEYDHGTYIPVQSSYYLTRSFTNRISNNQSALDILGYDVLQNSFGIQESNERIQELLRRQYFLNTFVIDQLGSTARGNNVYLAAWTQNSPTEENLDDTSWSAVDTTLYLVELASELEQTGTSNYVFTDQMSWISTEKDGLSTATPGVTTLVSEGVLSFDFAPLPENKLETVEQMYLIFERTGGSSRDVDVNLWDWQAETWRTVSAEEDANLVRNSERFIGPQNRVSLQIIRSTSSGQLPLARIGIEQQGTN